MRLIGGILSLGMRLKGRWGSSSGVCCGMTSMNPYEDTR